VIKVTEYKSAGNRINIRFFNGTLIMNKRLLVYERGANELAVLVADSRRGISCCEPYCLWNGRKQAKQDQRQALSLSARFAKQALYLDNKMAAQVPYFFSARPKASFAVSADLVRFHQPGRERMLD
jgi:hypothetical protein